MGNNLYSACHKCKEKVFHYRNEESKLILPFYRAHKECAKESLSNVITIMDNNGTDQHWMEDSSDYIESHPYKGYVHQAIDAKIPPIIDVINQEFITSSEIDGNENGSMADGINRIYKKSLFNSEFTVFEDQKDGSVNSTFNVHRKEFMNNHTALARGNSYKSKSGEIKKATIWTWVQPFGPGDKVKAYYAPKNDM